MGHVMDHKEEETGHVGPAGWIAIGVLFALLIAALAYSIYAWGAMGNTTISTFGWIMMGLGIFFTLSCGVLLMGLVFYSSRKNFDR